MEATLTNPQASRNLNLNPKKRPGILGRLGRFAKSIPATIYMKFREKAAKRRSHPIRTIKRTLRWATYGIGRAVRRPFLSMATRFAIRSNLNFQDYTAFKEQISGVRATRVDAYKALDDANRARRNAIYAAKDSTTLSKEEKQKRIDTAKERYQQTKAEIIEEKNSTIAQILNGEDATLEQEPATASAEPTYPENTASQSAEFTKAHTDTYRALGAYEEALKLLNTCAGMRHSDFTIGFLAQQIQEAIEKYNAGLKIIFADKPEMIASQSLEDFDITAYLKDNFQLGPDLKPITEPVPEAPFAQLAQEAPQSHQELGAPDYDALFKHSTAQASVEKPQALSEPDYDALLEYYNENTEEKGFRL